MRLHGCGQDVGLAWSESVKYQDDHTREYGVVQEHFVGRIRNHLREITAAPVVNVYARRMQIEETFRDMQDPRWSFAPVYARSRTIARREILLLIAALAMRALWLLGLAARALHWQCHFQASTPKFRS